MDPLAFDEELRRLTLARVRPAWAVGAALQLAFWALDVVVAPELRWTFLALRVGLVALATAGVVACLRARTLAGYRVALVFTTVVMGMVVSTMTFLMGGFGALYTYFVPLPLFAMAAVAAWSARDGAAFLGISYAYYLAGNVALLARGQGTAAQALGGALFVGTGVTFAFLTLLYNGRALRAELRLRADLERSNQALQRSVQALGEREGRLAAIGGVTSAVVHDARNPVTSILSLAQGALEDARAAGQAELAEDLAVVVGAAQRLRALFEQVQAFARAEGPPPQADRLPLAALAEEALGGLARPLRSQGISLEWRATGSEGLEVLADRAAVRRVLEQLVRNAERSILNRRAAGEVVDGRIRVEGAADGRRAHLRVVDDGHGVAPEIRARLFHPFVRAGPGAGHGLGLAVSRSLLRASGGDLTAEEPPAGGGAAFVVALPLAPREPS